MCPEHQWGKENESTVRTANTQPGTNSATTTLTPMGLAAWRIGLLEALVYRLEEPSLGRKAPEPEHLVTGRAGELAAYFYLRRQGYTVVARDWKSGRAPGDIDLIAWEATTLCFVEVKTRTTRDVATAESAIDTHKLRTLTRLAGHYLRQLPEGTAARFDVVSVYLDPASSKKNRRHAEIELYRGAFDLF